MRELGKQIGGLGNKFGYFAEGMALPSLEKLLSKRFGVEEVMARRSKNIGAESIEIDALGVVNGARKEAYIVEVKSHLCSDDIPQIQSTLRRFRTMFPEYTEYKAFGILAVAHAGKNEIRQAWKEGLFVVRFDNHLMRFYEPDGFVPTVF